MPYREEEQALSERVDALQKELEALRAQTRDLADLKSREGQVSADLQAASARLDGLRGKRSLPMLDQIKVASPCNASWEDMTGDDRVRFCGQCEKNVYNLSAMPREDAERLLAERLGGELCVRFYQRADGTVLTEDCPVGMRKKRRRRLALAVAGAGAMAAAAAQMLYATRCTQGEVAMGAVEPTTPHVMGSIAPTAPPVMGEVAPPKEQVTPPAEPTAGKPPHVRMGKPMAIPPRGKSSKGGAPGDAF